MMTHNTFSLVDADFMQQAIALAKRGVYHSKPNPAVGCVLVKDQAVIGAGFTAAYGGAHAEVFALRQAGEAARGATAYVTLEPCAHYGKTPPCAKALIAAGVARVVIACLDPNPLVAGKGLQMLQQAGIDTAVGLLAAQAREVNQGFLQVMSGGRPYVRLKMAASLDGRTAMASGESKWITGDAARLDVQHWRAISGAVITGINTVLADDPQLNVRTLPNDFPIEHVKQPVRVVLDRQGRFPAQAQLLQQPEQLLVVGKQCAALSGVEVWQDQGLLALLNQLKEHKQVQDVLVETGPTLAAAFLQQQLVDELIVYLAPTLLGSTARPMFDFSLTKMQEQYRLTVCEVTQVGADIRLILKPKPSDKASMHI